MGAKADVPGGPPLAASPNYRLDVAGPVTCVVGQPCAAVLVLTALGKHKVNDEYPTKFVAAGSPDVSVEGTGKFAVEAKQRGVMTLDVKVNKPGDLRLEGTFKLSVCTDERCEIESPTIALQINAT